MLVVRDFHALASDCALLKAVADLERGLIDADLGSHLFKQRVALPWQGKRGSTRTLLATRFSGTLYFLFGFEKKIGATLHRVSWVFSKVL